MRVKKIIPLFVVFAMVTSLLSVPAHATYGGGVGRADLWEWTYGLYQSGNTDFNPGGIYGDGVGREELAAAYSTYVSTLDRTVVSSDNSIVSFHPFYEYFDNGSSADHSYSYASFARSIDFSGIYDTTSLTLYNKDYVGHIVGLVSSPLSLPEGQYTVPSITVTARNPYFGVLGSCCFYLSVCRYEESTCTFTELNYYKLRPSSNYLDPCSFTTNALNFYATSDYLYFVRLSFSGRVQYLDQTSGYTLSAPVQLLLNGESAVENPPASTRTASLAQTINTYAPFFRG